jgi:hypothetical protein
MAFFPRKMSRFLADSGSKCPKIAIITWTL